MSIESRLARGDNPEDVAKLFNMSVEDAIALQQSLVKKSPKKKAAKKKAVK